MKALKALVIFLGVLIVAGVGLVIYGISSKVGPKPAAPVATNAVSDLPNAVPSAAAFGSVEVTLPDGAAIQQVFAAGDRVIVRVGTGKGAADRLIVLDPARGQVAGSFGFVTAPETGSAR